MMNRSALFPFRQSESLIRIHIIHLQYTERVKRSWGFCIRMKMKNVRRGIVKDNVKLGSSLEQTNVQ